MKRDIILAGVGGQGILSVAAVIGFAALDAKLKVKQSEVHGMSQRGGAVVSHLRISDSDIFSDLIPFGSADIILSVEPMEALRYISYLSKNGVIVTNDKPFINIPDYPDISEIIESVKSVHNSIVINADEIARSVKAFKSSNVVMIGAAASFLKIPVENLVNGIRKLFGRKGDEIVNQNIAALQAGIIAAQKFADASV